MFGYEPYNIGMIGLGTVGRGVLQMLREHGATYAARTGRTIAIQRVLVRDASTYSDIDLPEGTLTTDADDFFSTPALHAVIEVAGGVDPIRPLVDRALAGGCDVITANKALLAAQGRELFAAAHEQGRSIAFEASCAGGIPIVTSLMFGVASNRIEALHGILNGTCNYILTQMTRHGTGYDEALKDAQAKGYAEADPTLDVSGRDAADKLAILGALAFGGWVSPEQIHCVGIDGLSSTDLSFADELGYEIKLIASADVVQSNGQPQVVLSTEPCLVRQGTVLGGVHDAYNAVSVVGDALGHALLFGRGAGQGPTASAVVSDVLNVASGWYGVAFARAAAWLSGREALKVQPIEQQTSRFYLRLPALDTPGTMAAISRVLGDAGVGVSGLVQHESDHGQFVPVVITTHPTQRGILQQAIDTLADLDVVEQRPTCFRVIDEVSDSSSA